MLRIWIPSAGRSPAPGQNDMAIGDMAQFMSDHALHLIGVVGRLDQPGIHVDGLAARGEGVDRIGILDQHDA